MFDSKKKMKVATGSNLKHKLSSKQRQYIDVNQCLLYLYTNQVSLQAADDKFRDIFLYF